MRSSDMEYPPEKYQNMGHLRPTAHSCMRNPGRSDREKRTGGVSRRVYSRTMYHILCRFARFPAAIPQKIR
ncbi:hypothetical protein HMPREF1545_04246 [Oscillibacter sp. KLE 1728]|nr:hypothetical protein HMPREF1545_04246 [Oscillibacter sp. KLE 1728]